jgi:23S rRNA (adenine2503-C2)-methyltransferase
MDSLSVDYEGANNMDIKPNILDYSLVEIEHIVKDMGQPAFRAKQIFKWLHTGVTSFKDMNNISQHMRQELDGRFIIGGVEILQKLVSKNDGTAKYLFLLRDGNIIESVVMPYSYGNTQCLSTQVGCRMGCRFCASTREGLVRNLTPGEMLSQVFTANKDVLDKEDRDRGIKNIVLMGSGEPLDNYDNVIKFIHLIHDPMGMNISYRNITLSTCGLVPNIIKLAHEDMPITLSLSLHAPNDELRRKIMPIGSKYSVHDIIDASRYYFKETGRRVTFEYALMEGVNDGEKEAFELSKLLGDFDCHVNVIPVNPIEDGMYRKGSRESVERFISILRRSGINVTKRRELGSDINGACGQLKRSYLKSKPIT